jgi:hypothetical protein
MARKSPTKRFVGVISTADAGSSGELHHPHVVVKGIVENGIGLSKNAIASRGGFPSKSSGMRVDLNDHALVT